MGTSYDPVSRNGPFCEAVYQEAWPRDGDLVPFEIEDIRAALDAAFKRRKQTLEIRALNLHVYDLLFDWLFVKNVRADYGQSGTSIAHTNYKEIYLKSTLWTDSIRNKVLFPYENDKSRPASCASCYNTGLERPADLPHHRLDCLDQRNRYRIEVMLGLELCGLVPLCEQHHDRIHKGWRTNLDEQKAEERMLLKLSPLVEWPQWLRVPRLAS